LADGRLPNFIVAGVSRAGTTTLFNALSAHPQVCGSSTKETRYFQSVRYGENLAPVSEYQAFFRRYAGEPVTMECTPDYFYGGAVTATAIRRVCGDPRITVILREPLSRLISYYQFMQARLQVPPELSLAQYVQRCQAVRDEDMNRRANNVFTGLWGGQYARFLPDWLQAFPGRCDIYFFDDLVADPARFLAEQCVALGIDPDVVPPATDSENSSAAYRSRRAQRVAALAAKRSRAVFKRYPWLYTRSRRMYESLNQRPAETTQVAETLRREITAIYQPWNDLLAAQLRDAGHRTFPTWLDV
jgi:hypothetical protein